MLVDRLFDLRPERPGYRLQRLEVFNWGTFDSTDGRIYSFEPQGRTSLLVGCNGSGKSTLVDAILTLLVPSSIRNYNVAAGARKTERNERSYIRGAYGRGDVDDASAASVKYLRPLANHLTALLAVFRDETLGRAFTLCQVLCLKADAVDQVYAIADEARSLKQDLAGLQSSEKIRTHLQRLGYRTTKAFNEYDGWIGKRTGMRGKAMDMFNQTVAVKDIHSLNDFIRKHMLESRNWREKVQPLLTHFHDLSAAHQELLRAQLAEQLLAPIETFGTHYRRLADELSAMERRLKAAETYFAVETVRLCEPELANRRSELAEAVALRNRLTEDLEDLTERIRILKNDIDIAGGQRLRDLPALIREETVRREAKEQASIRYHGLLKDCGIVERVRSAEQFAAMRNRLQADLESNGPLRERMTLQHEERLAERAGLNRHIQDEQAELRILSQRQTNLASRFTWMRGRICEDLQIAESILPFAAELISVAPDERRWEASIELALRPLALSLLVPERLYARVRSYVERSRLEDERGEGQRLVYLRVGRAPAEEAPGDRLHPLSMLRKLSFRLAHDLTPWVRAEVLRRYDYRCCDTVELACTP